MPIDTEKSGGGKLVSFMESGSELMVVVDGNILGFIGQESGFYVTDRVTSGTIAVSSDDLRTVASKAEEVRKFGTDIPYCPCCGGTPNFPEEVLNPNRGVQYCQYELHHSCGE